MKLDKRTRDALCAIAMGVLLGIIVFLLQRRFFNKEGYEGEEKPETAEEEAAKEPEELVVESEDVGEAEIDEFDEELKVAQEAEKEEDLELPTKEDMDEEIEEDATKEELITALSAALNEGSVKPAGRPDDSDDEEEKMDVESTGDKIAKMAQDALLGEIMKVATE